jgi:hypothetical protein
MIDTKEAEARVAVAEFEARQFKRRADVRARRWRLAASVFRILVALGAGIYLQVQDWQISGAQACGLLFIYIAATVWEQHRLCETIQTLQAEVDQLKSASKEVSRTVKNERTG